MRDGKACFAVKPMPSTVAPECRSGRGSPQALALRAIDATSCIDDDLSGMSSSWPRC